MAVKHKERSHAKLSASASHRWLACPPSAQLCADLPDTATDYAKEGTCAHELAEYKINKLLGIDATDPTENLEYFDQEMADCTDAYAEYIAEQISKYTDPIVMVEQRLDFSRYVPDGFGTGDCVIVPFHAKITGKDDRKNYTQYLIDNAGGAVLSWLIEGARKVITANFQIEPPQCVKDAIGNYREDNDWLGRFLAECCEVDSCFQEKSSALYQEYRRYCNENGEFIRSTTDFYGALDQAGFERKKTNKGIIVRGLRLEMEDFLN